MQPTRRCWAIGGLAWGLAGLAVVLARPALLGGAALVGAWLVARAVGFARALVRTEAGLGIDQRAAPERVSTDVPVRATLSVSLAAATPLRLQVTADPPAGATGSDPDDRTVSLAPGRTEASTDYAVRLPIAGEFVLDSPTVEATGPDGLFRETLARGAPARIVVRPRRPRDIHVGEGGERIGTAYGDHEGGRRGSGTDLLGLREYTVGDDARRIDWKATARLGEPKVRETETESDLVTALLVDQRASMGDGPAGETKLDYARELALALVADASDRDDPLGLYTVGDAGITSRSPPEAIEQAYTRARRRLVDLVPTPRPVLDGEQGGDRNRDRNQTRARDGYPPDAARRVARRLEDDRSAFAAQLGPFFAAQDRYVERVAEDPLFRAARSELGRLRGTVRTFVLTDDTDRTGVRETVRVARRGDDRVVVFLLPTVLFEAGGLTDLDEAYERYREFEAFRRQLADIDRVTALEVAPGDRLRAVLGRASARDGMVEVSTGE